VWIEGIVAVVAYAAYVVVVLGRAGGEPLSEVAYAAPLLWTIGGAILAGIVLNIAAAIVAPEGANEKDQRDREINRIGEHIGQSFVVIGGVAALGMALVEWAPFWIANVIYLCFVLSAVVGAVAKVVAYRRGFQSW
jgi:NADH:ubiquinone oxidoreductase subunit 6 (subunit J)